MNIWEKLARCDSPGEVQRMVRGTGWEIADSAEIKRLRDVRFHARMVADLLRLSPGGDQYRFTGSTTDVDDLLEALVAAECQSSVSAPTPGEPE